MTIDPTNVIPFRSSQQAPVHPPAIVRRRHIMRSLAAGGWWLCGKILFLALLAGLSMIFLILWWLRGPVRFVFGCISAGCLLALPLFWIGVSADTPSKTHILLMLAGMGLGSNGFLWLYDSLLLRLAPDLVLPC